MVPLRALLPGVVILVAAPSAIAGSAEHAIEQAVQASCDKKVVALGELPSHGEARAFAAKAAIVQGLAERCGFSAVLFEAPLYEFQAIAAREAGAALTAEALQGALGKFWTVDELASWRDWLRSAVDKGLLYVGGLDDQPSATSVLTRRTLPRTLTDILPDRDREACRKTLERHLEWTYDEHHPFDAAEQGALLSCTRNAYAALAQGALPSEPSVAAANAFQQYVGRQTGDETALARDSSMYQAYRWHSGRLPQNARIVIWTATVHAARHRKEGAAEPLGAALSASYGDQFFSLAFTAQGGASSMAGGEVRQLKTASPQSLETMVLAPELDVVYVEGKALALHDGRESRLYGSFTREAWSQHFDAVVIFRNEIAPANSKVGDSAPPP